MFYLAWVSVVVSRSRAFFAARTAHSTWSRVVARSQAQSLKFVLESSHWVTRRPEFSIVLSLISSIPATGTAGTAHCGRSVHQTSSSLLLRGAQLQSSLSWDTRFDNSRKHHAMVNPERLKLTLLVKRCYGSPNVRDVAGERKFLSFYEVGITSTYPPFYHHLKCPTRSRKLFHTIAGVE